jgi:hypothetical protein
MNLYFCENIESGICCHLWANSTSEIPYRWTYIKRIKANHIMGEKVHGV